MSSGVRQLSIDSPHNPNYKAWLRLTRQTRLIRREGVTLAEGVHVVRAFLEADRRLLGIILRRAWRFSDEAVQLLAGVPDDVPRWELAPALFDAISPVENGSGLIGLIALEQPALPVQLEQDMVFLDGVQDPGNVGAILRTAAAAGVRHVLGSEGTAALWSPKVLRAAMGAHAVLQLHELVTPAQAALALKGEWIVAQAHGADNLWHTDLRGPAVGWIFGSEGAGPGAASLAMAHRTVTISIPGAVESLNVGAAAAVCLFERNRQRAGDRA